MYNLHKKTLSILTNNYVTGKGGQAAAMAADADIATVETTGWGDDTDLILDEGN